MAASATFALKAGVWFRRGRLLMVSPDSQVTACPLSGRNSTYPPVQILEAGSGRHEAMRDLTRARETAMLDLRSKRQQVSALLLRLGRPYPESKKTWTRAHVSWIASQKLEHPQQR